MEKCKLEELAVGRKKLAKNTLLLYLLQAAKYFFPLMTVPYLTRVLGPDVYAVRAYVMAAMSLFLMFLEYGFNASGAKTIAEASSRDLIGRAVTSIAIARILLCIAGVVPLVFATLSIEILRENFAYVFVAYAGTCLKAALPDFVFQGLEEMGIVTKRFVFSQIISVVCIIVFVKSPADLLLVPAFEGLASGIALAWSWHNVFSERQIKLVGIRREHVVQAFRCATPFFVSNASTTILTSFTTIMIGAYITDAAEISYWSVSMMAVSAIQALFTPISNSLYPHMVKRKDFVLAKKVVGWGSAASLCVTLGLMAFSPLVMNIVAGSEYSEGASVLALVAPVVFFSYPAIMMGVPILAAVGRAKEVARASLVAAIFQLIGLFGLLLAGGFTIVHIAILRDITELVLLLARVVYVRRCIFAEKEKYVTLN